MKNTFLPVGLLVLALAACSTTSEQEDPGAAPRPLSGGDPRGYVAHRTKKPLAIDGRLDEAAWRAAAWTDDFADIRGEDHPTPPWFRTRAKMLWDDEYFYVGAELEEPHVWATLTKRDSIIFYDNDFEVFIDPDGDTHEYYEHEMNAFGTDWDLFLVKPYRDGGPAIHGWDITGLKTEVSVDGTINDPSDVDRGWSVEIAMPWAALEEAAHRPSPPEPGDVWRVNFSRVEWHTHVEDGRYVKDLDPETGKSLPEENWVWSPQGVINMHCPETWGLVRFSGTAPGAGGEETVRLDDLEARRLLRDFYFAWHAGHAEDGSFRAEYELAENDEVTREGWSWPPEIVSTPSHLEASLTHRDGYRLHIRQDGKIWRTED